MEENLNTQNVPEDAAHEGENREDKAGKMFTQDDVNRIVQERLARDRAKRDKDDGVEDMLNDINDREASLAARESKIKCHELVIDKGYSKDLLNILDTNDFEKFQEQAESIEKLVNSKATRYPDTKKNPFRSADQTAGFAKSAHVPKQYGV